MSNLYFYLQRLPDTRVMAFHAMGPTAKDDANQLMQDWFLQQQLPEGYVPRIFAYHKKNPQTGKADYGYEMLISLPEAGNFTPVASVSTLPACDYLCVTSTQPEWQFIKQYLKQGPYYEYVDNQWVQTNIAGFLNRQFLEEQHVIPESIQQFMMTSLTPFEYNNYTVMIPVSRS